MIPIDKFLTRLKGVRRSGRGWIAKCPAHDDRRASLSVHEGAGGRVLLKCHAGCRSAEVVGALQMSMADLFPAREGINVSSTHRGNGQRESTHEGSQRRVVAVYDYADRENTLLYQVVRLEPKDFRQRRPDGRGGWIWNLDGVQRVLYRLPELYDDPDATIYVVEGERDADNLHRIGLVATCNPGGAGKWRPEYSECLRARHVVVIPDKDDAGRRHAQDVAQSLHGIAASVKVLELPGEGVKDASDWIAAGGTRQQLEELAAAAPLWKAGKDTTVGDGASDDGTTARDESIIGGDEHTTNDDKGGRRTAATESASCPYRAKPAGLFHLRPTKDGPVPVQLTNFTAVIRADVVRDDGAERESYFEIEAVQGERRARFTVAASRFASMAWAIEHLGAEAIIFPGFNAAEHARVAVQLLSPRPIPRRTLFTHTGWREIGGEWVYLHASGAIGAGGAVDGAAVDLDAPLRHFVLPCPPEGEALHHAVRATLRLLELAPDEIVVPLFCAPWRAVLGPCDFGIHLAGPTGVFKSELGALVQQHFGPELDARHLPGSWTSTDNAIEAMLFAAKDAVVVVDDFAPGGHPTDIARWHARADRVLRAQGNNSGRGRMRPDGTLRPPKPPRGLTISTGEDSPRGQSLRARLLILEVAQGDVNAQRLTECQRDARSGLYAQATSAFIRWLAPRYGELRKRLRADVEALRTAAANGSGHCRTSEIVANLLLGLRKFLDFAMEAGGITAEEADTLWDRAWTALGKAAERQAQHQAANEPARRFIELLSSAISSGHAHLASPDGGPPDEPAAWGWRAQEIGGLIGRTEWRPMGDRIGWLDDDAVALDFDAALRAAQAMAAGGDGIAVSGRTLRKRLDEHGWVVRTTEDELLARRTYEGRRRMVLLLAHGGISLAQPRQSRQSGTNPAGAPARAVSDGIHRRDCAAGESATPSANTVSNPAGAPARAVSDGLTGLTGSRPHIPPGGVEELLDDNNRPQLFGPNGAEIEVIEPPSGWEATP